MSSCVLGEINEGTFTGRDGSGVWRLLHDRPETSRDETEIAATICDQDVAALALPGTALSTEGSRRPGDNLQPEESDRTLS